MSDRSLLITTAAVLALFNVFPIQQAIETGGYVYYYNAHDETTYLQYDFSKAAQRSTRIAQYLVTAAHEVGLSGGWINLVFDMTTLPLFLFFVSRALAEAGFDRMKANLCAFLLTFLPLLFGGLNSLVFALFQKNVQSGMIYWVTVPEAVFLPLTRSPEPQFSLMLLSAVAWAALKRRSFWIVYPLVPLLYCFVAVPAAFVTVALHLKARCPWMRDRPLLAPLAAFLLVSASLAVYFRVLLRQDMLDFLAATHLPMLSFTSLVSLGIFAWGHRWCEPRLRYFLGVIALTPLATANQQVVSGWLLAPNAFEQYFGVLCAACVLTFSVDRQPFRRLLLAVSLGLVLISARYTFLLSRAFDRANPMTPELMELLRTDSPRVAINDPVIASICSMVYPKQRSTRFSIERSFHAVCSDELVREYLSAKKAILADERLAPQYERVFEPLDEAYRYESSNFILLHAGRKKEFKVMHDLEALWKECEPEAVHCILTKIPQMR